MNELELIIDKKAQLAECPVWDDRRHVLLWVDILGQAIHVYDPQKGTDREINMDRRVGAVALRERGGLVAATGQGFFFADEISGAVSFISDPEAHLPENRFNDGKCDHFGRFWAGTMANDMADGAGALYCMETNMEVKKVLDNVSVSNGLAWSIDHAVMYYIDTKTRAVSAFNYNGEKGEIHHRRQVVMIDDEGAFPDGMTIDAEGMIWVALWNGWKVVRFDPSTGAQIGEVKVPASQVTCCTFGGEHLDELYITTARAGLSEEALKMQPDAGGVFCVKPGIRGVNSHRFDG
jgi:sugar lactone lactonase YvrE